MDTQNSPQADMSGTPPEKGKGVQIFLGIVAGIIQLIVIGMVVFNAGLMKIWSGWSYISVMFIVLLIFLPLILEMIFLKKTSPYFVRGAIIGTLFLPLIGLGFCFVLLATGGKIF